MHNKFRVFNLRSTYILLGLILIYNLTVIYNFAFEIHMFYSSRIYIVLKPKN